MSDNLTRWAPLPIRLVTGSGLVYHGAAKFSRNGHANIASMVRTMGLPFPELSSWAIALIELFGGLAIVTGTRTRFVSGLIAGEVAINLLIALKRGGYPKPLPGGQPLPGTELSFFYGAGSAALLLGGAGPLSVDATNT